MIKLSNKFTAAVLFSVLAITGSAVATAADEVAAAPAEVIINMQKMQEQMSAIHATIDPKVRATLMDEHMQTMQSTLPMMQHDKGCMMMGKGAMGSGKMKDGESAGGTNTMQMMMEQMAQHQKAMQGAGK